MDKLNCREDKIDRKEGKKKWYIIKAVSWKLATQLRNWWMSFKRIRDLAEKGDLLDALDKKKSKMEENQTWGI